VHIENWYVLCIAALGNVTVEQAFEIYSTGKKKATVITEEDTKDMIKLRQKGLTYKEIGEIYCMNESSVCNRIIRFMDKEKKPKQKKSVRKKKTVKYIEKPEKLIQLKEKYTYKEIAKMYNTYPNKIYMTIRDYKTQVCC
jgi:Mor family transcriptional regulator